MGEVRVCNAEVQVEGGEAHEEGAAWYEGPS
jgi:hypothetical protein